MIDEVNNCGGERCTDCTCYKDVIWYVQQCGFYIGPEDTTNDLWVIEALHPEDGIIVEHFGKWIQILEFIQKLKEQDNATSIRFKNIDLNFLIFNVQKDKDKSEIIPA